MSDMHIITEMELTEASAVAWLKLPQDLRDRCHACCKKFNVDEQIFFGMFKIGFADGIKWFDKWLTDNREKPSQAG